MALCQGAFDDLATGIVRIGHQVARLIELEVVDEAQELVQ
jgi:hypothetical protein